MNHDISESMDLARSMPEKTKELEAMLNAWLSETKAAISKPVSEKKKR